MFARDAEANDIRLAPFPKNNDATTKRSLTTCSTTEFATGEASESAELLYDIPESDNVSDDSSLIQDNGSPTDYENAIRTNEVADAVFDGMIGDILMNVSIYSC